MFLKKDDSIELREVIERNIGIPIDEFQHESRFPKIVNLKEGVSLVYKFIKENPDKKIYCVGDYDVDGVSASSIVDWGFQKLGKEITVRIPKRLSEGYGLSSKIIDEFEDNALVITVDNGIAAISAIEKAKSRGMTVIVIDHHLPSKALDGSFELPPADIIIDPHIYEESEYKPLCGAALAYYFVKEMFPDAKLIPLLVLASIATVTDVMPLTGVNRTLVKDGIDALNKGICVPGLAQLIKEKNLSCINEEDYGFLIGPIFNASGRLYDNGGSKVVDVLTSKRSNPELPYLVHRLISINEKRKSVVKESMIIAESLVTSERPIVIHHPSFEEGVVGIIAGQLAEKYQTPCIVFTTTPNGIYKGSGRSTENFHLKNTLDKIQDTMIGFGGHAGAAGISVNPENFENFKKAFVEAADYKETLPDDNSVFYDIDITENSIPDMIEELKLYAPFGEGNPKPVFHLTLDLSDGEYNVIGDGSHFSITMNDYKIMGFHMAEKYERLGRPKEIEAVVYLSENWFNGRCTRQVELIDFEIC